MNVVVLWKGYFDYKGCCKTETMIFQIYHHKLIKELSKNRLIDEMYPILSYRK